MAYTILHNDEFDYAKSDSRLAAYGGVVLQRFEFIKVCLGRQRLCWKSQLFLYCGGNPQNDNSPKSR